ncbi:MULTISPECIES: hypothetical protein [Bradyrhizobium]|uniref:hypothetical protein n=1 Tax=Bradyrhizobium TaxID=374 RepID=UPI00100913F8|nr:MULTISPECIES: hypothetical protein [Bradyrhizobium]
MNPFKNIIVNLQASGISAIACIWLLCVTTLAILAPENGMSRTALNALLIFGGMLGSSMVIARRE